MIETVENLKPVPVIFNGGVDETAASDALDPGDAVEMLNWRLSKDGRRVQKRAGLQVEHSGFGEDVYGYSTYVNSSGDFCQLAILESKVMRKVGSAAWATLFSFSSNIDHTVKVFELGGKQFIITEKGSRVIQADGNARQVGITAPTAIPTAAAEYATVSTPPLNEVFNYADTTALSAVWTDDDFLGTSSISSADPDGVQGPDLDSKYLRLEAIYATYAARSRTLTTDITGNYSIDIRTYFDHVTSASGLNRGLHIKIDNGLYKCFLKVGTDGAYFVGVDGINYKLIDCTVPVNKWVRWNFSVSREEGEYELTIKGYCAFDGYPQYSGELKKTGQATTLEGLVQLQQWGQADTYVDSIRITAVTPHTPTVTGLYRYAVSFVRDGDYGCESNPIKSEIGSIVFSGTGLNDMTLDSESSYTGEHSRVITVKIKTAASPQDTIQWSYDGGSNWAGELKLATKVHLGYGITVNFGAITGHDADATWTFSGKACSAIATNQQIRITSIQTSSDEQVTARKLYRTAANGSRFFYLTTIYDRNTTTEFVDNFADAMLGDEMLEDRDLFTEVSSTIGRIVEHWDDRLWVADHSENVVYYTAMRSGGGVPEEFDIVSRFLTVRRGQPGDVITAMKAYKDSLYIFKRNDIFIVQKTGFGYGIFHLNSDVGCIADNCVEEVNDLLAFPSERGLEIHDGVRPYSPDFSVAVSPTFLTGSAASYKYMSMVHDKEYNELWMSIPDRTTGDAITIVWNYIRNKFYQFQFYKTPSCLVSCKDSVGKRVVKMGTRDGFLLLCDYGTADHTTPITSSYRKGWLDIRAYGIARLFELDYELPASKTLTVNFYVNMEKDVFRTASLTGNSPTATDASLRRVISDKIELGIRGRFMAVEFINAEDCGGDCKLNEGVIYVRSDVIKKKISAD